MSLVAPIEATSQHCPCVSFHPPEVVQGLQGPIPRKVFRQLPRSPVGGGELSRMSGPQLLGDAVVANGGSELKPQLMALGSSSSQPCMGQCVTERSFSFTAHPVHDVHVYRNRASGIHF